MSHLSSKKKKTNSHGKTKDEKIFLERYLKINLEI